MPHWSSRRDNQRRISPPEWSDGARRARWGWGGSSPATPLDSEMWGRRGGRGRGRKKRGGERGLEEEEEGWAPPLSSKPSSAIGWCMHSSVWSTLFLRGIYTTVVSFLGANSSLTGEGISWNWKLDHAGDEGLKSREMSSCLCQIINQQTCMRWMPGSTSDSQKLGKKILNSWEHVPSNSICQ